MKAQDYFRTLTSYTPDEASLHMEDIYFTPRLAEKSVNRSMVTRMACRTSLILLRKRPVRSLNI